MITFTGLLFDKIPGDMGLWTVYIPDTWFAFHDSPLFMETGGSMGTEKQWKGQYWKGNIAVRFLFFVFIVYDNSEYCFILIIWIWFVFGIQLISKSIHETVNQWMKQWTNQPTKQSINQSLNYSVTQSINWLIHQSIYPPTNITWTDVPVEMLGSCWCCGFSSWCECDGQPFPSTDMCGFLDLQLYAYWKIPRYPPYNIDMWAQDPHNILKRHQA